MVVLMYQTLFFEATEEETWWENFKRVFLEFEDKEPHRRFPASRISTDEFCCITTMLSTTSTPHFLESALLDPQSLIA